MGAGIFLLACFLFVWFAVNYPGWTAIGLFVVLVGKIIVKARHD